MWYIILKNNSNQTMYDERKYMVMSIFEWLIKFNIIKNNENYKSGQGCVHEKSLNAALYVQLVAATP